MLDIEAANMDLEPTEGVEKMVTDTLTQLLQLGIYIHKLGRVYPLHLTIMGTIKIKGDIFLWQSTRGGHLSFLGH